MARGCSGYGTRHGPAESGQRKIDAQLVWIGAGVLLIAIATIAGTISFDSPSAPPPERSTAAVNVHLPPISRYAARDRRDLAYRRYTGDPDRVVIVIHGSAGSSTDMNALATALAAAGATVIAPDIRGHGRSGPHGDIAYIGQLEDDLDDLMTKLNSIHRAKETTLIGFSSGGGFALRIAGGRLGSRFSRFILLAPFLRHDAPNARPGTGSGGWTVAVPRIAALSLIDGMGVTAANGLPVIAFAVPAGNPNDLTATYSYRLLTNFAPDDDYPGDLRRTSRPIMAMDGADDETFIADKLQTALAAGKPGIHVVIVPGVGHDGLVTTPAGTAAIVKAWSSRL